MKTLYTEIEIEASAEQVWNILTDFSRLPQWNPFMIQASGELKEGQQIEVRLQSPDMSAMTIKPTLLKVEPLRELRWLGHMIFPGLFDGEHIFTLEAVGEKRVKFVQREEFGGMFAGLVLRFVGKNTQRGFEAMNQALKSEAEQQN